MVYSYVCVIMVIMLPGNYGVLLVASDSKSDLCLFLVSIQNATFSF